VGLQKFAHGCLLSKELQRRKLHLLPNPVRNPFLAFSTSLLIDSLDAFLWDECRRDCADSIPNFFQHFSFYLQQKLAIINGIPVSM
jgi:hypothetical protein